MNAEDRRPPSPEAIAEESRRVRRLRVVVQLTLQLIAQGDLPYDEASELVSATRRVAIQLFPGKEATFDLIYLPKFQRLLSEVYRLN